MGMLINKKCFRFFSFLDFCYKIIITLNLTGERYRSKAVFFVSMIIRPLPVNRNKYQNKKPGR
jgi:hypothetical protein